MKNSVQEIGNAQWEYSLIDILKAYISLVKPRLSFLVVFSAGMGFMLGHTGSWVTSDFIMFLLGGFLMTGGANTINQIIEKDLDVLMKRTCMRALPQNIISVKQAIIFSIIISVCGFIILLTFANLLTAFITLLSSVLYSFAYTPLKRVSSIAVLVGAIPGALPPLIGWAAATNSVGTVGVLLFGIQFFWQFPHFWAIAWVLDEDYRNAGFKLLPFGGKKDLNTAFHIMIYTLMLIPLGLIPVKIGITGIPSAIIVTVCGIIFLAQTFHLMRECNEKAARMIMFGSFLYLPIVQIALVWDKL